VPDGGRHYRVEVLSASLVQHGAIWVNGAKFEFSAEVIQRGADLKHHLAELCACLSGIVQRDDSSPKSNSKLPQSSRTELSSRLESFDLAWVGFEQAYINQLIEIEKSARGLLVQAIQHERALSALEAAAGGSVPDRGLAAKEHADVQRRLFACLSRLNSVANVNRKGREDLGPEVFDAAALALRKGEANVNTSISSIITEVLEAYQAMRDYLRRVEPFLEQVAPRLSENVGLAARLAQLEEGWELGATYLLQKCMRDAISSLVMELKAIQYRNPRLTMLIESCDVEWLLVLPKLVWLCFLEHPMRHVAVMKNLLPHRFPSTACEDISDHGDAELRSFWAQFDRARKAMTRMASTPGTAWDKLVRWIAFGTTGLDIRPADLVEGAALWDVVEFVRELDHWSMELQRHCPQDWNQCSSLVARCLIGTLPRVRTEAEFVV
jgi:hypothetical protein